MISVEVDAYLYGDNTFQSFWNADHDEEWVSELLRKRSMTGRNGRIDILKYFEREFLHNDSPTLSVIDEKGFMFFQLFFLENVKTDSKKILADRYKFKKHLGTTFSPHSYFFVLIQAPWLIA
jgi:hypothetical protein